MLDDKSCRISRGKYRTWITYTVNSGLSVNSPYPDKTLLRLIRNYTISGHIYWSPQAKCLVFTPAYLDRGFFQVKIQIFMGKWV